MDLEKIGKFITKKRQENNFTQESLAEKLDISNRAISKWERGICLPDANNMAKLTIIIFGTNQKHLIILQYNTSATFFFFYNVTNLCSLRQFL